MSAGHYAPLLGVAASVSLLLAGCGSEPTAKQAGDPATGAIPARPQVKTASDDTDLTIWTVLGLGRRESEREVGPQTGATVSPVLWLAARDTLNFAGISSEDPITGL